MKTTSNQTLPTPGDDSADLANLWRVFGLENEMGKKLFNMYNKGKSMKPQINYPKVKTKKPADKENSEMNMVKKACPQMTKIAYPPLSFKHMKSEAKYSAVDFIPKRKPKEQIFEEIENHYKNIVYDIKKGVDREQLKKDFRQKLLLGTQDKDGMTAEESLKVHKNTDGKLKQLEKKYMFRVDKKNETEDKGEAEELNFIFDEIVKEIEERQKYLSEIETIDNSGDLQRKVKSEIVERIGELQKITNLLKKHGKRSE